jgi:hypothetical protein
MAGAMMALMNNIVAGVTGPTPGSIYFPTVASRVTLAPGIVVGGTYQSPFTVQGWFYSGDTPGTDSGPVLLSTTTASGTPAYAKALTVNVSSTTQIIVDSNGATSTPFNLAQTLIAGAWYYVALSRDASGFMQIWLGKQGDASAAASTSGRFNCSVDTSGWALTGISNCIGAFVPAGRYSASDYISGVRVTNTNLYTTTDATIPMPTSSLGWTTGIKFLQSTTDLTDFTLGQSLASVGSAAYSATGPSISPQAYTPSSGSALFTKANTTYLSTTVTAPSTDSITYEWWFRATAVAGTNGMLQTRTSTSGGDGIDVYVNSGTIGVSTSGTFLLVAAGTVLADTWYHIAVVRNGTTNFTVYLNGTSIGTFSKTGLTSTELYLGEKTANASGECFDGYITNFRYVKGSALYTSNFTPSTEPLTAIPGTDLLLNTVDGAGFLTDSSNSNRTVTNNNGVASAALNPF